MTVTMTMEEYMGLSERAVLADKLQNEVKFWQEHSEMNNKQRLAYQEECVNLTTFICDSLDVDFAEAHKIAKGELDAETLWEQRKSTFKEPDEECDE